ncbi:glycosyltransferase family 2 protein [Pedobacter frigiditerrae]|uniref:Glycosyltransferase family 2 protein n=1 Tax=Pedobacter frigiditerrae TaxID=2530452 RepID=A0A4R0N6R5_9SPHI|nr:glycosyltransferase family 2 protein [Pedobacter frigiditerrae]TCC93954.1 glycosyltransferase family 2 protein [Pedobacter frigiditerrae]
MALTSIITVNFHQTEVTIALLKSISKSYTAKNVEVLIVDNGADKNQELIFHPHFNNIKYIQSKENLGFAGGNNLGLKQAKGDYIFLLNNDTEIPAGCIEAMIAEMEANDKIGLLSPLLLYYDQKDLIQYAGYTSMNYVTARNENIGSFEKNTGQYDNQTYETGFCHGAAMMCRKTDLLKAGLMDESYFLYYEELDWCEKFKSIGKQIWFTGNTYVYHKESISVGKESAIKTYFMTRNRMLFIRKNTSWLNTILFVLYYTFLAMPKTILALLVGKNSHLAKWAFKGLLWNYTHTKSSKILGFKIK